MAGGNEDQDRSRWTLGAIRRSNLALEASCKNAGCGWFGRFDLGKLIERAGPDYELPEGGPGIPCEKCGGMDLKFELAALHLGEQDGEAG